MRLEELEISNYRSIKSQSGDNSIQLRGLDCLVGKNNAGKTNILSAIKFLLEKEDKDNDIELYYNLNPQNTVEVRGFFKVTEDDLSRIPDKEKREACRESLIDEGEHEGQLGICRIEDSNSIENPELRRLVLEDIDDSSEVNPSLQSTEFKHGTKQVIRNQLLPEVISIPAVREVSSTMKRSGEFGNLIKKIQSEIQEELDKKLQEEVAEFNLGQQESIAQIENRISGYLEDTFDNQSVKFGFPRLSTEYLFRNADIKIQEEHLDELSKENVGEGVKRTVIFSLLRTLADLRSGQISFGELEGESDSPPFLILYEEAELFLHPSLQQRLLGILQNLSSENSQVVFSTHSPVMIQHETLDTINIVRKNSENGSYVTQFHSVLKEFTDEKAERARLTQMERVSSYIFADTVVLVEGVSDRIFIKKVSPHLDSEWDFDDKSIPVLDVSGKTDVRMFYQFLNKLNIETHCMLDIDAIQNEVPELANPDELKEKIDEFNELIAEEAVNPVYSEDELESEIRQMPWDHESHPDAFGHLEDIMCRIRNDEELLQEDADVLEKVLAKSEQTEPSKQDYTYDTFAEERMNIVEQLLDQGVLLLSGEIEDYFPTPHGNNRKRQNAIVYNPDEDTEVDNPTNRFMELDNEDLTDIELFLRNIFDGE